jgi:hypothetical protein
MASPDEIFLYLPQRYKTQDEENYIKFLWESFELNYQNEKYQFAFIAYHLLFMTYVYFQLWKIYASHADNFRRSVFGFGKIRELFEDLEERNKRNEAAGNPPEQFYPFNFAEENESTIMTFFHLIGCDKSKIGTYKKLIKDRNEIAHANGKLVFVSSADIDQKINQILKLVEEIHQHSCGTATECLNNFLLNDSDIDTREYIDEDDQINEVLIRGHYLSQKNIEDLLEFDIEKFKDKPKFNDMKSLFDTFTKYGEVLLLDDNF